MTKKDLIESVSQKAKLSKKAAKQAVETFLGEIMKAEIIAVGTELLT